MRICLRCQFSPLPSCEDCLPAAASAGKAASYQVPKEEEFRWPVCGGQQFLVNEPLDSVLHAACEDEDRRDFTSLEFGSVFWQYQAAGGLLA